LRHDERHRKGARVVHVQHELNLGARVELAERVAKSCEVERHGIVWGRCRDDRDGNRRARGGHAEGSQPTDIVERNHARRKGRAGFRVGRSLTQRDR
jgi:hypothetical protein